MQDQLMLWSEEVHARTSPSPESAQGSQASAADSGSTSSALPSSAKRRSSSGKTSAVRFPATLDVISESSSVRWPTQGMMRAGVCSALPTLERHTDGSVSSLWGTPTVQVAQWSAYQYANGDHTKPVLTLLGQVRQERNWATPDASVMNDAERPETFLARQAALKEKHINGNGAGTPLAMQVKLWPTVRASEWKGTGPLGSVSHQYRLDRKYLDATVQEQEQASGLLAADWVECLMGWPDGWTRLPAGQQVKARRSTNGSRRASRAKRKTGSDG
jgi:hypothetical protein